ncbi:MAG: phosphatidate cytidylyltransferase [Planctomycetota bacterium]|jgi:phosphatidate cytidylyltransferase
MKSQDRWRYLFAPLLTAVVIGALLIDHHFYRRPLASRILVALLSAAALYEFYGLCRKKGRAPARAAGILFLLVSPLLWIGLADGPVVFRLFWTPLFFFFFVILKLVVRFRRFSPESAGLTLLGYVYVGMFGMLMLLPRHVGWHFTFAYYFLFLFLCAKASDTAAYLVGKAIGRRKLAPSVSPKKTWEGAIAGVVAGTGLGLACILLSPLAEGYKHVPVPCLLLFALCVTIASQVGDLVESAFKRWAGAKDSGRFLPAHGGVLDLIDNFLISVPVAYVLSELMTDLFGV